MKKIAFGLLPFPQYTLKNPFYNHLRNNLSAGYIKSSALHYNLLDKVLLEILDQNNLDLGGDAFILNQILDSKAIALVLNLQPWNTTRSLYLAQKIKKLKPNTLTVGIGPQISKYSAPSLMKGGMGLLISGDPEFSFCCLLKQLAQNTFSPEKVQGIFYKKNNKIIFNPLGHGYLELNNLPSFYMYQFLDINYGGNVFWLETSRGCPYHCAYCYRWCNTSNNPVYYPLKRVKEELILAKLQNKRLVKILDHTLNYSSARLKELSRIIQEIDPQKQLIYQTNMKAELIDKKTAELLDKCNFRFIAVGLQSTNPLALGIVNRKNYLDSFLKGIYCLRQKNISVNVEIILGLPGETYSSICETIDFLVENELNYHTEAYILSIYPSTPLWDYSVKHNITFQKNPPHLMLKTKNLPFEDFKRAINYVIERKCRIINEAISPSSGNLPFFTSYSDGKHFGKELTKYKKISSVEETFKTPFTKIILDLKNFKFNKTSNSQINLMKNHLAQTSVIWFLSPKIEQDFPLIIKILKKLSFPNPYLVWHIALDTQSPFNLNWIERAKKTMYHRANCIDYQAVYLKENYSPEYLLKSLQFYILIPPSMGANNKWFQEIKSNTRIIWKLKLNQEDNYKEQIIKTLELNKDGVLLDFSLKSNPRFIGDVLKFLNANAAHGTKILFKNWVIQREWQFHFQKKFHTEGTEENIIWWENNNLWENKFKAHNLSQDLERFKGT